MKIVEFYVVGVTTGEPEAGPFLLLSEAYKICEKANKTRCDFVVEERIRTTGCECQYGPNTMGPESVFCENCGGAV